MSASRIALSSWAPVHDDAVSLTESALLTTRTPPSPHGLRATPHRASRRADRVRSPPATTRVATGLAQFDGPRIAMRELAAASHSSVSSVRSSTAPARSKVPQVRSVVSIRWLRRRARDGLCIESRSSRRNQATSQLPRPAHRTPSVADSTVRPRVGSAYQMSLTGASANTTEGRCLTLHPGASSMPILRTRAFGADPGACHRGAVRLDFEGPQVSPLKPPTWLEGSGHPC